MGGVEQLAPPVAPRDEFPVPRAEAFKGVPSPPPTPDDPEKAAEVFADQAKQQADAQIKTLTAEAEQLHARLKKVESAIARWQSLRAALDARPGSNQGADVPPTALEPALGAVPGPLPAAGPADANAALAPAPGATPAAPR